MAFIMKKILFLGFLTVLLSTSVLARDTNSMRSTTETVFIGDSEETLLSRFGSSKPRYYVYNNDGYVCAVTEYRYQIDMQEFKVLLCRGKIFKIDVINK